MKLGLVIDLSVLRLLLLAMTGWLDRQEREALTYLVEEHGQSVRFTHDDGGASPVWHTGWPECVPRPRDDRHAGHVAAMAPTIDARTWTYLREANAGHALAAIRQLEVRPQPTPIVD
jgi:hypothetical protein